MNSGEATNRGLKLTACLCFLLIAAALLLIDRHSPAKGYELSIYESLPPVAWIMLVAALAGGTVLVVREAFAGRKSPYWVLGFCVLAFSLTIILLLPAFRGYLLYGALDTITHIDFANSILLLGHFDRWNQYPITHILIAQLVQVTGGPTEAVGEYVPVVFTVLYMLFSYLLASAIMPRKGQILLAAATTPLFFNYYHVCTYPQSLSIMALPLLFYLYFRSSGRSSTGLKLAFVTLLFLFPYFHPAPAGVLVVSLLAAEGAKMAWRAWQRRPSTASQDGTDRIALEPTLMASVAFLTWISSHAIFYKTIWNTLGWLKGEIEAIPRVAEVETMFQTTGLGLGDQVVLALKMYGDNLVYLLLSFIALLVVAWRFLGRDSEVKNLSILSLPFLVSGPAWVLIFASTLSVTLGRLLGSNVMMWATPVFAAFALYVLFRRRRRARVIAVTAILLLSSVMGIAGVYHSPFILQTNWQVTRQEVDGMSWFQQYSHPPFGGGFVSLGVASVVPGRLHAPDRFGYATQEMLGESFPVDTYLLLAESFRQVSMRADLPSAMIAPTTRLRADEMDLRQLHRDRSLRKVYSNGELDIFAIEAKG